jgi:hypothetical protein
MPSESKGVAEQLALIPALPSDDPLEVTRVRAAALLAKRTRKGVPNFFTREFRELVFRALDDLGGHRYLVACAASADPEARKFFWDLVKRTAPANGLQALAGEDKGAGAQLAFAMYVNGDPVRQEEVNGTPAPAAIEGQSARE